MKNIHLFPTDKPSRLHLWTDENGSRLELCELEYSHTRNTQNIYITNDEEIKEGDYGLGFALGIKGVGRGLYVFKQDGTNIGKLNAICNESKKIILTTDQDLIKDGVQAIDDEFLEWFVKNPSCEFVEINKEYLSNTGEWKEVLLPSEWEVDTKFRYKIIIPQEEPKQAYYEEQKELRRKLLNLIDNLEKDELLRLSKEEANQETLENKLELLISEWNKRQLQYTDLASQNIDCSHTTKKFTYKAMATRDCWKELLTLLNNHKDDSC